MHFDGVGAGPRTPPLKRALQRILIAQQVLGYMDGQEPLRRVRKREDGFYAPVALRHGLLAHRFTEHLPQWAHAAVAYSHNATI